MAHEFRKATVEEVGQVVDQIFDALSDTLDQLPDVEKDLFFMGLAGYLAGAAKGHSAYVANLVDDASQRARKRGLTEPAT